MSTNETSEDLFPENFEVPAAYWRIALAGIIDAAFAIFCVVLLYRFQSFAPVAYLTGAVNSIVIVLVFLILYRLLTISFFNATFGMFLLKIQFLNGEDEPLTFSESVMAALFVLYAGVNYYNR